MGSLWIVGRFKKNKKKSMQKTSLYSDPVSLLKKGKIVEAEKVSRKMIESSPNDARAYHFLGLALLNLKRYEEASEVLEKSVSLASPKTAPWFELGNAFRALEKWDAALSSYQSAIDANPDHFLAMQAAGDICINLGKPETAVKRYQQALSLKPDLVFSLNNMGLAFSSMNRLDKARECFERAIAQKFDFVQAYNNLGVTLKAQGNIREAVDIYQKAIEIKPDYADACANMLNALYALGRFRESVEAGKKALKKNAGSVNLLNNLGNSLQALGKYEEALPYFEKILKKMPGNTLFWCNYASLLAELNRFDEAVAACKKALSIDPGCLQAFNSMGNFYFMQGDMQQAETWYAKGLDIAPESATLWRHFSKVHKFTPGDTALNKLEKLAAGKIPQSRDSRRDKNRSEILFALSMAYDDLDLDAQSFEALIESNALYRKSLDVDIRKTALEYRNIARIFSAETLGNEQNKGYSSDVPVFVLGMPRSGTTLVEQILSSHPEVYGAGELFFLNSSMGQGVNVGGFKCMASNNIDGNQKESLLSLYEMGKNYVENLIALSPYSRRITDKMPGNFAKIGLIHLALPGAKIIHCRRNPLDTALSCFQQRFTRGIEWSFDLRELAGFYNVYHDLMSHWRTVLPQAFIEVDYEELVNNTEKEARKLIDYIGLEWSDACLEFYDTERVVRTASMGQVRKPVYHSSINRWKKYDKYLTVLRETIKPEILEAYGIEPLFSNEQQIAAALHSLNALYHENKFDQLISEAKNYLEVYPDAHEIWSMLSCALRYKGFSQDALDAAKKAVELSPENGKHHGNLGLMYKDLGFLDDAKIHYEKALHLNPDDYFACNNMGILCFERGWFKKAEESYKRALDIYPEFTEAANNLGNVYYDQGKYINAQKYYERALETNPSYIKSIRNIGMVQRSLGHFEKAKAYYDKALAIEPDNLETKLSMAKLLGDMGRFEEAEQYGLEVLKDRKSAPDAISSLMRMRKMTLQDGHLLKHARALLGENLFPRQLSALNFALGKYHDDLKEYEKAFEHYSKANALIKDVAPKYNPEADKEMINRWISVMNSDLVEKAARQGSRSELPVFILGMPRSGTTLIEQIISSHPLAAGAGELSFWGEYFNKYREQLFLGDISSQMITDIEKACVENLRQFDDKAERITDKMPGNYAYLGLIHAVFPRARIIHARRHPVDTCLSIFFQNFNFAHAYSYDLQHLVERYRLYQKLMEHWCDILPENMVMEVVYEDLIEDQELWTKRIIDFAGLPWDDSCIDFHLSNRPVQTASKWQVRQKIYKTSKARWERYEPWLGPLRELF